MNVRAFIPWFGAMFMLAGGTLPLRADATNTAATSLDRRQIREELKNMTPEERRAKIEALRKARTVEPAPAQRTDRQPSPAGPERGGRMPLPPPGGDFAVIRLLTEEQRGSFRAALAAQREQARELEEKLRSARGALIVAGLAEKFDENVVQARALEVGRLEAELAVLRARALSQVKPPLSAEQIEQMKNPPPFRPVGDRIRPVRRVERPAADPRDEHDLPASPKPEK